MSDDLFGPAPDQPGPTPRKREPIPVEKAPDEPCACGSTEWWVGLPNICKKCRQPHRPKAPEPVAIEQVALPGFPADPVPHAPPEPEAAPEAVVEEKLEMRAALSRLRQYRVDSVVDERLRAAIDVVLERLGPEYPEEPAGPKDDVQAPLFNLGDAPPAAASAPEPIRVYVHFERAADVADFGVRLGVQLGSSVRRLRYSRGHAECAATGWQEPIPESSGERDKTFADLQTNMFGDQEWWADYWRNMPPFEQRDLAPVYSIEMEFASWEDVDHFEKVIDQDVPRGPKRTPSVWFPEAEIGRIAGRAWVTQAPVNPLHPVYVISKGRWDTRLTQKHLEANGIPYHVVVEPQEFESYAAVMPREKLLALPFSNLGQGSIPARNWVWQHAVEHGWKKHWILDDNIDGFYRLHKNLKLLVRTGATFRAIEDWCERYDNIGLAGMNYFMFASRKTAIAPLTLNTRIYSCILVNHALALEERWRGRYNEDTDLSIRALKAGWSTALFNAFLCLKQTTMTMKGGNTEALYKIEQGGKDGRLLMAESLKAQHPELVQIVYKWGRWQHSVDYRSFRVNRPRAADSETIGWTNGGDYGLTLLDDQQREAA